MPAMFIFELMAMKYQSAAVALPGLGDVDTAMRMRDSSLVGYFTVSGRTKREPEEDRYDISSVEKVADDKWRFNVRMRHGSFDVTMPVVVPVKWVDDTPVVTLTDWNIPSLGTFTCRVLFHGDRYAGTWQHGPTGGLMYGRIEKQRQP